MRWLISLLLLLVGCAHAPVARPAPHNPSHVFKAWAPPLFEVVVPPEAPACAVWSAQEALSFLHPQVPYVVRVGYTPDREGVVRVVWSEPEATARALTNVWFDQVSLRTERAVMYIHNCEVLLFAHELGHALGLWDQVDPGKVMHWRWDGVGWGISPSDRNVLDETGSP